MNEDVTAPAELTPIAETSEVAAPQDDAPSRMDSISKAFEAVDGPAESAQGNEQTKDAETAETTETDGQPRTPDGRFATKDGESAPEKSEEAQGEAKPVDDAKDAEAAPSRFSADAKAEWDKAPASVKGEINRAVRELESGLQQKDAQLAPLKQYFDLAEKHGKPLDQVLSNYIAFENHLHQDLKGGLSEIARTFGMTFDDMIAKVTGGESSSTDKDRTILDLQRQVQDLTGQVQGISTNVESQREAAIKAEIDAFAAAHPRYEEHHDEMVRMIETGYATDLADAYAKAERLNPAPQPETPAPLQPAQTRQVRSVTGAPNAGSDPGYRKPSNSRMEAISRAMSASGF